jgi:formate-dependent nitrite reductase membrane component NrfD
MPGLSSSVDATTIFEAYRPSEIVSTIQHMTKKFISWMYRNIFTYGHLILGIPLFGKKLYSHTENQD